jgi:phosphoserine phosphatase
LIVVSDLIGTLTLGSPTIGLVSWVRRHQSPLRANFYMVQAAPRYLLTKIGLLDFRKFGVWSMVRALPLIRQATPEIIAQMAAWAVERELWPKRREDIVQRLAEHLEAGDEVVIASTTYEPAVELFAERLGAAAIGSPVDLADGSLQFTSEFIGSERKGDAVFRRLGLETVGAAYGDTWADIPILERADKPVAVYPDAKLEAAALERGWEIIGKT